MNNKPRFRHEWKYLINEADYAGITARLLPVIRRDPNARDGGYTLRSLYFDDYWDTAYSEKLMGVNSRKKYRIRIYDYTDRAIKLECKNKQDSYIYKVDASLTRAEFYSILDGDVDFLLARPEPLCKEFYLAYRTAILRPRVIVDYEREPFIMDAGQVRITFDRDVRAAIGGFDIFDSTLPCLHTLETGKLVMEVKYTDFLPDMLRAALPPKASEFTAVSKYVLCCDAARHLTTEQK